MPLSLLLLLASLLSLELIPHAMLCWLAPGDGDVGIAIGPGCRNRWAAGCCGDNPSNSGGVVGPRGNAIGLPGTAYPQKLCHGTGGDWL